VGRKVGRKARGTRGERGKNKKISGERVERRTHREGRRGLVSPPNQKREGTPKERPFPSP